MGTQGSGRKRLPNRERLTAEDDALNQIAREVGVRRARGAGGGWGRSRSGRAAVGRSVRPPAARGRDVGGPDRRSSGAWGQAGDADPSPRPGSLGPLCPLLPGERSWGNGARGGGEEWPAGSGANAPLGRAAWWGRATWCLPPPPPEAHGQSPEATWRWLKGLFLVCDHGSSIPTQVQLGHKLEVTVNLVSGAKTGPGALRGFHPSFVGSLFERLVVNLKCGKLKERCAPSLQVKQTGDRGRLTLGLASAAPCGRGAHWASGTKDA